MAADQPVHIRLAGRPAALLTRAAGGGLALAYLPEYSGPPLSVALPPRDDPYQDAECRPWLGGLLPEGEIRQRVQALAGLSPGNEVGLLAALGGDCPGAVSFSAPWLEPVTESDVRTLTSDEFHGLVMALREKPLLVDVEDVRQLLPGGRLKLSVLLEEDRVAVPLGAGVGTHIIKPAPQGFSGFVDNEAFCMQLAGLAGLPVAQAWIHEDLARVYCVRRFDRSLVPGQPGPHQESFAQALRAPPGISFEREGGPALIDCFELLRRVSLRPAADMRALLRWTIFNYLVGNALAHARNLALLGAADGPVLAPFHALQCTAVYPELQRNLAMRIGGEERPDWLTLTRWRGFADQVGIRFAWVREHLAGLSEELPGLAGRASVDFQHRYGHHEVIGRIVRVIEQRARKLQVALAAEA